MIYKLFLKWEKRKNTQVFFYEANIALISKSDKASIRKEILRLNHAPTDMQKFKSKCCKQSQRYIMTKLYLFRECKVGFTLEKLLMNPPI